MTKYKYTVEVELRQRLLVDVEAASPADARRLVSKMNHWEAKQACEARPDLPGEEFVRPITVWGGKRG